LKGADMSLISDILMTLGAFGAALYCFVLSSRLKKFTTLESGMGSAIAVLSAQVDDMTKALDRARAAATGSASSLEGLTTRAEAVAQRIELLLASMHDLPGPGRSAPGTPAFDDGEDDGERKLRFVRRRAARSTLEAAE
jgi:hypothetical protein